MGKVRSKAQKGFQTRKRKSKKSGKKFSDESKAYLMDRDPGGWHNQQTIEHRQRLLNTKNVDSVTIRTATPPTSSSAPLQKLCASAQKIHAARNRIDDLESTESNDDESEEEEDDELVKSDNKLCPPENLWIVDFKSLEGNMNDFLCCKYCYGQVDILEQISARQGLGTKIQFNCKNVSCESRQLSYGFNTTRKKEGQNIFEVNERNVLANRFIGKGRANSEKFCSIMGLARPIRRPAWKKHATNIDAAAISAKDSSTKSAADRVKSARSDMDLATTNVEIPTSFDASWSSRGWTARDGLVAAIAEETAQVLDVLTLTNSCPQCTEFKNLLDDGKISSDEHTERYLRHEERCSVNHDGSSSSMETAGVQTLFERSEEDLGLRYNPYIGDGDSASYSNIDRVRPYGQSCFIKKDDCVGHVTKRMGTNLREVIRTEKGNKLSDGKPISGKGRLTLARVDTFQAFYGKAIRDNKGDAKAMSKATTAILDHYSSTIENPKHENCPEGVTSWCSFQRSLATEDAQHIPIKNPIAPAIYERIKPVFDRLSSIPFLEGSVNAYTQNANESLHHVIWGLAPKDQNHSSQEIRIAVNLGVCLFNDGFEATASKVFEELQIPISPSQRKLWRSIDEERIRHAQYRDLEKRKIIRKKARRKKCNRQDAFQHLEGRCHYGSNQFYNE